MHKRWLILVWGICTAMLTAEEVRITDFSGWARSGSVQAELQDGRTHIQGGMQGGELRQSFPQTQLPQAGFAAVLRLREQGAWNLAVINGLDRIILSPAEPDRAILNFPLLPEHIKDGQLTLAIKLAPEAVLDLGSLEFAAAALPSEKYVPPRSSGPVRRFASPAGEFTIPPEYEDVSVPPRRSQQPLPPAAGAAGLRHYQVDDLFELHPQLLPEPHEFDRPIALFAAPDQYEAAAFGLYASQEAAAVTLSAGALYNNRGESLPVPELRTIRVWPQRSGFVTVTYRDVPELLEKNRPLDIPANQGQAYYVKCHIPAGTASGIYQGNISVSQSGRPALTIPLSVRVLNLPLVRDTGRIVGVYYGAPDQFSILQNCGFNSVLQGFQNCMRGILKPLKTIAAQEQDVTKRLEMLYAGQDLPQLNYAEAHPQGFDNFVKAYQAAGFKRLVVWFVARGFTDEIARFLNLPLSTARVPDIYPASITPEYGQLFKDIIRAIDRQAAKSGLETYYYQFDELGVHPDAVVFKYAVEMFKLVKEAGAKTLVTCTDDEFLPMVHPWLDTRQYAQSSAGTRAALAKIYASTKAEGREFFSYSGCVYEQHHLNRYNAGLNIWLCGWEGKYFWNLASQRGNAFNDFDRPEKDAMALYHHEGEYIPTLQLEALREGIDDLRYLTTLEKLLAEAAQSPRLPAQQRAAEITRELAALKESLPLQIIGGDSVNGNFSNNGRSSWDCRNFQRYRWRFASLALQLQTLIAGNEGAAATLRFLPEAPRQSATPPAMPRQLHAPRLTTPPAIDGRLNDDCWRQACHIPEFVYASGQPASIRTQAWLARDDKNLYLAFCCAEPDPKSMVLKQPDRDVTVWRDDSVEVFIDGNHDHDSFKQIIVSALGVEADLSYLNGKGDLKWDCRGLRSAAAIAEQEWYVEMSIPLSEVASQPVVGLNLQRARKSLLTVSTLVPDSRALPDYADLYLEPVPETKVQIDRPVRLGHNRFLLAAGAPATGHCVLAGQEQEKRPVGREKQEVIPFVIADTGDWTGLLRLDFGPQAPATTWSYRFLIPP
ncbi:MAG: hypothetical protein GX564_12625, partial [Oligosphaeraceae bacterium]|nr:hypothetical protein [Oligosphaeraceae bacterium]